LSFQLSANGTDFFDLHRVQATTDRFVAYEAIVPAVVPNAVYIMPEDTGSMISHIRFRSGTKSAPVVQISDWIDRVVSETRLAAGGFVQTHSYYCFKAARPDRPRRPV
jgi:hypothetical protein